MRHSKDEFSGYPKPVSSRAPQASLFCCFLFAKFQWSHGNQVMPFERAPNFVLSTDTRATRNQSNEAMVGEGAAASLTQPNSLCQGAWSKPSPGQGASEHGILRTHTLWEDYAAQVLRRIALEKPHCFPVQSSDRLRALCCAQCTKPRYLGDSHVRHRQYQLWE